MDSRRKNDRTDLSRYFDGCNKQLQHQVQPSSRHWHLDFDYMGGYIQHFKSCSTIYRSRSDKNFWLAFSYVYTLLSCFHAKTFEMAYIRVDVSSLATASSNVDISVSFRVTGRQDSCVIVFEGDIALSTVIKCLASKLSATT